MSVIFVKSVEIALKGAKMTKSKNVQKRVKNIHIAYIPTRNFGATSFADVILVYCWLGGGFPVSGFKGHLRRVGLRIVKNRRLRYNL